MHQFTLTINVFLHLLAVYIYLRTLKPLRTQTEGTMTFNYFEVFTK